MVEDDEYGSPIFFCKIERRGKDDELKFEREG